MPSLLLPYFCLSYFALALSISFLAFPLGLYLCARLPYCLLHACSPAILHDCSCRPFCMPAKLASCHFRCLFPLPALTIAACLNLVMPAFLPVCTTATAYTCPDVPAHFLACPPACLTSCPVCTPAYTCSAVPVHFLACPPACLHSSLYLPCCSCALPCMSSCMPVHTPALQTIPAPLNLRTSLPALLHACPLACLPSCLPPLLFLRTFLPALLPVCNPAYTCPAVPAHYLACPPPCVPFCMPFACLPSCMPAFLHACPPACLHSSLYLSCCSSALPCLPSCLCAR
jgi:hypothetical protein